MLAFVALTLAAQDDIGVTAYDRVCRDCHGREGRGDIGPPIVPLGYDADYLLAIVREGYIEMPPISSREISDEEIAGVAAYLDALGTASPTPTLAITGAQLIDGTGAKPVADSVVLVREGRIQAAGPRAEIAVPTDAEIVDATGRTLIPGLVETHAHYFGDIDRIEEQYRKQLYFGVTTARCIGTDPPDVVARALAARAGTIPGPRMYTAGLGFSTPDGFPPTRAPIHRPASEAQAREQVGDLASQGVHFVKMWVNEMPQPGLKITPGMRAAIVGEALARDLVPVAHINEAADVEQLIGLGVTDFLHTVEDTEVTPELLRLFLDAGVTFSPTLTNIHASWLWAEKPELLDDPEMQASFEPEALERWQDSAYRKDILNGEAAQRARSRLRRAQAFVKAVVEAGVPVAVGTDSGSSSWNVPTGWGTHHELQLYVGAGLSPMQAIVAATRNGAELLSVGSPDYGTLVAGQIADLVLLDADPLEDISNTLRIGRVMQGGRWLDRATLMP